MSLYFLDPGFLFLFFMVSISLLKFLFCSYIVFLILFSFLHSLVFNWVSFRWLFLTLCYGIHKSPFLRGQLLKVSFPFVVSYLLTFMTHVAFHCCLFIWSSVFIYRPVKTFSCWLQFRCNYLQNHSQAGWELCHEAIAGSTVGSTVIIRNSHRCNSSLVPGWVWLLLGHFLVGSYSGEQTGIFPGGSLGEENCWWTMIGRGWS